MDQILSTENIEAGYQNRRVLHNVSISVKRFEKILLIGPNGCGKTTLLKIIAGMLIPEKGRIIFKNKDVTNKMGHRRIRLGLGYLMQTRNTFPSLTVEENLHLSFWYKDDGYYQRRNWVLDIFPILKNLLPRRAGLLSGGEQQALAISMVLMRPVEILLLDEPTAGLSPKAATGILEAIHRAQEEAYFSTIVVEHNLRLIQQWVSRVIVMNQGQIVVEEPNPAMLLNRVKLQDYYFG